eukprot:406567-Ditylum_brightwellii.AAC.1
MLGIRKAAMLQESSEISYLHRKITKYVKAISACTLQAHEIWLSYITVLNSSITYSLACKSVTSKKFSAVHRQILPVLLPRLGYQHNFPGDITFGPKLAGDIGCSHYLAVQLSKKVAGILKHVRANLKIGRNFLVLMRWAQLCTGVSSPLLQKTSPIPYLEGQWLQQLREDLLYIN